MKNATLFAIASLFSTIVCAQQQPLPSASHGKLADGAALTRQNRLESLRYLTKHTLTLHGRLLSGTALLNPKKLSAFIKEQVPVPARNVAPPVVSAQTVTGKSTQAHAQTGLLSCNNASFFKIAGLTKCIVYVTNIAHTADDGVLVTGALYDSTVLHSDWAINAYLLKADNLGNILWAEVLVDQHADIQYDINPIALKEMAGGDIMLAAYVDTSSNGEEKPVTSIYHLSSTGAIEWHTELNSSMLQYENEWVYFQVKDINPGLNGDYIVSGTSVAINYGAQGETVVRLDANGNYIWDANLTNKTGDYNLGAEGLNAFVYGNNIVAIGYSHGSSLQLSAATIFTILDYGSGAVQSNRFFVNTDQSTSAFFKNFTYYSDQALQLPNGHYLLYDILLSAYSGSTDTTYYFGVQEYDAGFNPVNAYTINSMVPTPYGNTFFYIDKNADGYFSVPTTVNNTGNNLFFSTLHNNKIGRQRVTTFSNGISSGFASQVCFMNDGAYLLADDYYDPNSGNYFSIKKMYDSDTPSVCLGRDSLFAFPQTLSLTENPSYFYLDPPLYSQIQSLAYLIGTGSITDYTKNACQQTSSCQLLQIHGPNAICGANQTLLFTAHRNLECGATPVWSIDTSAISSMSLVDDTTLSVTFKNINWTGKLYASLTPPAACQLTITDSLLLTIVSAPSPPSLVADTILCPGNSIILKPGPQFANYLWQDGSKDSNYVVTTPGLYTVTVKDFCGNQYNSSAQVTPAQFLFSAGQDTSKCNADSIVLKATGGFFNYQWIAPNFQFSGLQDSAATVNPTITTLYTVTADKWPGCAVRASANVVVYHSPAIYLGNDTSFCDGGIFVLNAGTGFALYAWNTGQSGQEIVATSTGTYSVLAITSQGCKSYDTIQVTVYSPPVFSLGSGPDTTICSNAALNYSFPVNGDTYGWSDGLLDPVRSINTAGNYGLTVTNQEGCSSTQSIEVIIQPIPALNLGVDTTLCQGQQLTLNNGVQSSGASYKWQDGSTSPAYDVSSPGLYILQETEGSCLTTDSIMVGYTNKPAIEMVADTSICQGQQITIQPKVTDPGSYLWQDGSILDYLDIRDTGSYQLTVTNVCGTASAQLIVSAGLCYLEMPNAFTPNGDGKNDVFKVKYPFTASHFSMSIFDRWGILIYRTYNMTEGWDGSFHGAPQPAGTYVWMIELIDSHGAPVNAKGTLILIR